MCELLLLRASWQAEQVALLCCMHSLKWLFYIDGLERVLVLYGHM